MSLNFEEPASSLPGALTLNNNDFSSKLSVVGGTNVSHIKGNLVDLETDLRGTTRLQSKCPTLQYQNPCPQGEMTSCQPKEIVIKGNPSNQGRVLDTTPQHLSSCQMFRYKPMPMPPPMEEVRCNYY